MIYILDLALELERRVAAAGRQVTLLLARLKEAERLRAELCGEDARVVKILNSAITSDSV